LFRRGDDEFSLLGTHLRGKVVRRDTIQQVVYEKRGINHLIHFSLLVPLVATGL